MQLLKTLFIFSFIFTTHAQSVLDEIDDSNSVNDNLTEEKIIKISASKRIFIISNENSSFNRGDFVSLIFSNKLAVRGLIAKIHDQTAAFKTTKVYSLPLWKSIRPELNVKVIRGDDSYFNKKTESEEVATLDSKINSEEDLYNDTNLIDENLDPIQENKNRVIQPDNIFGVNYGFLNSYDASGGSASHSHPNLSWMYQFKDNIWAEVALGSGSVNDHPSGGLTTDLTSYLLKVKYAFSTPFYTFTMPYIGYKIISATNDCAGNSNCGGTQTTQELANEVAAVDRMNENGVIFGATVLKRLVPGWFARLDIGTDIVNLGIALEF